MEKNIEVVDEAGNVYEPTWPKRAKGLVKHGRARFVSENRICLACPAASGRSHFAPGEENKMEDKPMSNVERIFGEMTVADILTRVNNIINQTSYITSALEALQAMSDGEVGAPGAPSNVQGASKAEGIATVVQCRETTNQQILRLYEKMYNDMIRLSELDDQPKISAQAHIE